MSLLTEAPSTYTNKDQVDSSTPRGPAQDITGKLPSLFDLFTFPQPSSSLSTVLDEIDLDLECDAGDVEKSVSNLCPNIIGDDDDNDHSLLPAEVYTVSTNSSPYCIRFPEAAPNGDTPTKVSSEKGNLQENTAELGNNLNTIGKKDISQHASCHSSKIIQCEACTVQFSSDQALIAHNKDKHTVKEEGFIFTCPICGIYVCSEHVFEDHKKAHKQDTSSISVKGSDWYPCSVCTHVSKTKRLLRDHELTLHNSARKIYKCPKCSFTCLRSQTFKLHIHKHENEPKFACDQCGKLFHTMSIMKRHAVTHTSTCQYPCTVSGCNKTFKLKGRLTDHVRYVHNGRKPANCKVKGTNSRGSLHSVSVENESIERPHLFQEDLKRRSHDNDGENNDTFGGQNSDVTVYDVYLSESQMQYFQEMRPNVKGETFRSLNNQTECISPKQYVSTLGGINNSEDVHKKLTSFEKIPFGCQILHNTCNEDKILRIDVHSGTETPVVLKCDYVIKSEQHVEKSLLISSKIKTKCICTWPNCGKVFRDKYNLSMHMCTHTGETRRACPFCRFCCVQKSALGVHMKKHFPNTDSTSS